MTEESVVLEEWRERFESEIGKVREEMGLIKRVFAGARVYREDESLCISFGSFEAVRCRPALFFKIAAMLKRAKTREFAELKRLYRVKSRQKQAGLKLSNEAVRYYNILDILSKAGGIILNRRQKQLISRVNKNPEYEKILSKPYFGNLNMQINGKKIESIAADTNKYNMDYFVNVFNPDVSFDRFRRKHWLANGRGKKKRRSSTHA